MMRPTMELRWKERNELVNEQAMGGNYYRTYTVTKLILQQKWYDDMQMEDDEWRDVPTEKL